jgi:hypothetical protein
VAGGGAAGAGSGVAGAGRRRGSLTTVPPADDTAPCSSAEKYMFIFSGNTQSLMEFLECRLRGMMSLPAGILA